MASVGIKKHTTGSASSGQLPHNYRTTANYSNEQIDTGLSQYNENLGCRTIQEARQKFRDRVKAVDAVLPPERIRRDRVTAISLEFPAPRKGMSREDSTEFLRMLYGALEIKYGEDLICGNIHADEVHEYHDQGKIYTSRVHIHVLIVPNVPGKGINGRAFYRRSLPNELNRLADEVCMEMFGFPYRDGSKQKSRGTVEDLKAKELEEINRQIQTSRAVNASQELMFMREREARQRELARLDSQIADKNGILGQFAARYNIDDLSRFLGVVKPCIQTIADYVGADNTDNLQEVAQAVEALEKEVRTFYEPAPDGMER